MRRSDNESDLFLKLGPLLKNRWKPMLETPIRVELAKGKVVLSGKVDLTLGSLGDDFRRKGDRRF